VKGWLIGLLLFTISIFGVSNAFAENVVLTIEENPINYEPTDLTFKFTEIGDQRYVDIECFPNTRIAYDGSVIGNAQKFYLDENYATVADNQGDNRAERFLIPQEISFGEHEIGCSAVINPKSLWDAPIMSDIYTERIFIDEYIENPTNPEPTNPEPTNPEPTNPEPTNPEPTPPLTDPEPTPPEPTETKKKSGGYSYNPPPTLGVDNNGKRFVENGFSYNGNITNVDRYWTDYPLITTEVGKKEHC